MHFKRIHYNFNYISFQCISCKQTICNAVSKRLKNIIVHNIIYALQKARYHITDANCFSYISTDKACYIHNHPKLYFLRVIRFSFIFIIPLLCNEYESQKQCKCFAAIFLLSTLTTKQNPIHVS